MEFADTPIIALRHGARNDREHAAVELLDGEGPWLRREEIARHVTVTMPEEVSARTRHRTRLLEEEAQQHGESSVCHSRNGFTMGLDIANMLLGQHSHVLPGGARW